ncbi:MAG: hypothetical protein F6K18_20545 [Okeania sp. SIO2C2]|uniref:hypothetical protein n=1 Tax=Okeania sp. SIO2C2 TaxID=2607787 RepID=UPI0013BC9EB1|nr:hypothetical protein [Okeania sp. SIO2C2]NEP89027.1 hypothetical protein [Okeania sp. SIO2C2]
MNHKQNLVDLLSSFPNISTAAERQAFIDTVGLTKLANDIDIAGNTRTFFNTLIDVIVKTDSPNGLFNFIEPLTVSFEGKVILSRDIAAALAPPTPTSRENAVFEQFNRL